jgi:hypothetical protein
MHDWVAVASNAFGDNFRKAEEARAGRGVCKQKATESKDCQMPHLRSDHDGAASNESPDIENAGPEILSGIPS